MVVAQLSCRGSLGQSGHPGKLERGALPKGCRGEEWKLLESGPQKERFELVTGAFHPPVPSGEDVAAPEDSIAPPWESLPSEAPSGAPPAPVTSEAPVSPKATVASSASGENPRVAEGDLPPIYEGIEALGLTLVTQGEDNPLPATSTLSDLTPVPLSACSLSLTAASAPASEGPLGSFICPATGGALLNATKPTEATAGATQPGPKSHGVSLVGVGQPISFPGGDPTADRPPSDAVASRPSMEPEPCIIGGPLSTLSKVPEPDQEEPPPSGLATGAQDPASAPLADFALDPCPGPDANLVLLPSTSRDAIAAPGAVTS
ncbi:hypothetical protein UY3_07166 [Chelonia mydas]|uniref:Uncharacterized protein n=1 Tax=Chelonia mydas TaxID=8469 RepID=M7BJ24_CHEMY|nr:hypothetical protein UY3_07166 [Chelonia mydas]